MKYHRITPRLWRKMDREGWSDDERLLGLYLLTCQHRSTEGLFLLPKPYISADLKWELGRVTETLAQLLAKGFVQYDETVAVVLIPSALELQAPENPNQAKSALKAIDDLPESPLLDEWIRLAELHSEQLRKLLPEGLPKRLANRSPFVNETSNSNSTSNSISKEGAKLPPLLAEVMVEIDRIAAHHKQDSPSVAAIQKCIDDFPDRDHVAVAKGFSFWQVEDKGDRKKNLARAFRFQLDRAKPVAKPVGDAGFFAAFDRVNGRAA